MSEQDNTNKQKIVVEIEGLRREITRCQRAYLSVSDDQFRGALNKLIAEWEQRVTELTSKLDN